MGWLIIIGSLPIVVLGLLFQDQIETTLRNLWITATMLIVFGILLGIADYVGAKKRQLDRPHRTRTASIYGFAQALALIPGVSRSGGTITAGLFLGYERAAAARYAFLLAIPAVFGSGFYQVYKSITTPASTAPPTARPRCSARSRPWSPPSSPSSSPRRDRVLHELHLEAQLPALRDLPHRARHRRCSCSWARTSSPPS